MRSPPPGPGLYALIAAPATARRTRRDRGADDPAHRSRADGLARRRWADRAGARLLRRAAAAGRHAAAAGARTTTSSPRPPPTPTASAASPRRCCTATGRWRRARSQVLRAGDDFAALDLNVAAFDLSDRGVTGLPHPGPLDAYVWLDRGIYRPGETVQVMALLRDDAGRPADIPAHVTRQAAERAGVPATPRRRAPAEASVHLPVDAVAGRAGRHLDGRGAGRSEPAADRPRRVPRRCLRARPHGGRSRHRRRARSCRAQPLRAAGHRALPVRRARPPG